LVAVKVYSRLLKLLYKYIPMTQSETHAFLKQKLKKVNATFLHIWRL
jgi:hypothetical protein